MSSGSQAWCAERTLRGPIVALAIALAGAALACGKAELPAADGTYQVRGQVIDVPREEGDNLTVHHEALADFRDRDGKPSEMESMSMPFTVAPGVSLAGIAPGDKVEMTFEVRWEGGAPLRIVALHELPESTALDLGGPKLELVQPFGSSSATPTPTPATPPSDRPATDGPSAPPSETI